MHVSAFHYLCRHTPSNHNVVVCVILVHPHRVPTHHKITKILMHLTDYIWDTADFHTTQRG